MGQKKNAGHADEDRDPRAGPPLGQGEAEPLDHGSAANATITPSMSSNPQARCTGDSDVDVGARAS
jgi:hypothetical protein